MTYFHTRSDICRLECSFVLFLFFFYNSCHAWRLSLLGALVILVSCTEACPLQTTTWQPAQELSANETPPRQPCKNHVTKAGDNHHVSCDGQHSCQPGVITTWLIITTIGGVVHVTAPPLSLSLFLSPSSLFIYLSIYLSIHLSYCPPIYLSLYTCIYLKDSAHIHQ